jgi:acyl-CoA thioesterase
VGSSFELETAVRRTGSDAFEGNVDPSWWVARGPHGGYLSAIILRALTETLDNPSRPVRSFTTHFASAPKEGAIEIETRVERAGRSMSFLAARTTQGDSVVALTLAAFSDSRAGFDFDDSVMPEAPSPEEGFKVPAEGTGIPSFLGKFDMRWTMGGPPYSGSPEAVVGGWIRLEPPTVADAPVVACLLDAWAPAIFPRATQRVLCPTIDLTMHFRNDLPLAGAAADDFLLGRFSSKLSRDGFFEEDGELWSKDGVLIAQSRQLALALTPDA